MQITEIVLRLQEHSGLSVPISQLGDKSLAAQIQAARKGVYSVNLEFAFKDVINCLEQINFCCKTNGFFQNADARRLVYAVSGIQMALTEWAILLLKNEFESRKLLGDVLVRLWKINCAWDAMIAGDINDLNQHVEWEADARGIPEPH